MGDLLLPGPVTTRYMETMVELIRKIIGDDEATTKQSQDGFAGQVNHAFEEKRMQGIRSSGRGRHGRSMDRIHEVPCKVAGL